MLLTGTMGSYLKNINLQQKWQKKQDEMNISAGPKVVTTKTAANKKSHGYTAAVESFMKEQEEFHRKIKSLLRENTECTRASVEFKLQYGGKLSAREMEYIRNNCPDLYAKATEREKERQQYAAQLRNCQSKDEVFALRMNKLNSLMGEVKDAEARGDYGASFELRARLYNIEEEHHEFIKSDEYQELCRKEKAEKEAAEAEAREKKIEETPEENTSQDENIKPPDEAEMPETESAPGQEQKPPPTNPDAAKDKPTPDTAKHTRASEKRPDAHMAEDKIKSATDKYLKNKPDIARENFDVKLDAPVNSAPNPPKNDVSELKGSLSLNI